MYTAALERTEREVAELCRGGLDKDAFCRSVGERLARVVQFDGSCWHTIDPATLLITSHLTENIPDVDFPLLAWNEYVADDVNRFASLARGRRHVGDVARRDGGASRSAACGIARCSLLAVSTPSCARPSCRDPRAGAR